MWLPEVSDSEARRSEVLGNSLWVRCGAMSLLVLASQPLLVPGWPPGEVVPWWDVLTDQKDYNPFLRTVDLIFDSVSGHDVYWSP